MKDQEIIDRAISILEERIRLPDAFFANPDEVKNYLRLALAERESEVFCVMLLDNQHGLISMQELFQGTIDGASVYPREVVKTSLAFNAAAAIFAHNHPSGNPEPSNADRRITERLISALQLVDVRVLDHIVVGSRTTYSFAENGLI